MDIPNITVLSDANSKSNDTLKIGLTILFTVYFVVYAILFLFALHNTVKFILPKISSRAPQIVGFYVLALLMYVLEVFGFVYTLAKGPEQYIAEHDFIKVDGQVIYAISCVVSDEFAKSLYVLMTLTLYHSYLAIAKVNGNLNDTTCRWRCALLLYSLA